MATTTNYGWVTPDDTALVKDGAAAIRTLGTSADTTVYNNDLAAIKKAIVDAKGDIIAATAADTVARLAVGATNGMVLTVDSTEATGLKYALPAGGMTLITRNAFTTSSTLSVDSLFSDTYENYLVTISCISSVNSDLFMRARSSATDETGSYYSYGWAGVEASGGSVAIAGSLQDKMQLNVTSGTADNPILSTLTFFRSSGSKQLVLTGSCYNYRQERGYGGGGVVKVAQTWTGLSFFTSTGTITGTLSVYGLAK